MTGAMTELTLDVVGAALFGHQFGDLARKMKTVVTSGLRAAEVATRLLMVARAAGVGGAHGRSGDPPRAATCRRRSTRRSGS